MRLTYFGHSAFRLELAATRLVFDPFLRRNPHGAVDPATIRCDYVLCSHAHDDHLGDTVELCRLHGATLVAPYELAEHFAAQGLTVLELMPGGGITLPWGRIEMTPAVHSSSFELGHGETRPIGVPAGYVVRAEGKSLYHAGDTALFGDMALIGRLGLDLALLPIGDFYTMGPRDALDALRLLRPKLTIPMHYNTFDRIRVNPHAFADVAAELGYTVNVLAPGATLDL